MLAPYLAASDEHVGRTLLRVRPDVVIMRAYYDNRTVYGDRPSKIVISHPIIGS